MNPTQSRKAFWQEKQSEADRLARLEKWEKIFSVKIFPEILLDVNRPR